MLSCDLISSLLITDIQGFQVPDTLDVRYLQPSPHFHDSESSGSEVYNGHYPGDGEGEDEAVESERHLANPGM